jgi:hypothetical protein
MGKKKKSGISLIVASIIWFIGWSWLFGFDKLVLGICLLVLAGGIVLILED